MMAKVKLVDVVKWLATVIQLIGYGMTGLNLILKIYTCFSLEYFYGLPLVSCGKIEQLWLYMLVLSSHY